MPHVAGLAALTLSANQSFGSSAERLRIKTNSGFTQLLVNIPMVTWDWRKQKANLRGLAFSLEQMTLPADLCQFWIELSPGVF